MGLIVTSAMTSARLEVPLLGCRFKWWCHRSVGECIPLVFFWFCLSVLRIRTQLPVALARQDQRICESCSECFAPDLAQPLTKCREGTQKAEELEVPRSPKVGEPERSPSSVGSRAKSRQPCPSFAPRAPTFPFQTWSWLMFRECVWTSLLLACCNTTHLTGVAS